MVGGRLPRTGSSRRESCGAQLPAVSGLWQPRTVSTEEVAYAKVWTITGPATAVAGPTSRGIRFCSIHATPRLFDSSAPA
jgi:hypothetical protein